MVGLIIEIVLVILSAFVWACLSYFLEMALQPFQIFSKWGDMVDVMHAGGGIYWKKILGGCTLCSNIWLGFVCTLLLIFFVGIGWYWMLLAPPISNFFVRRFYSFEDKK